MPTRPTPSPTLTPAPPAAWSWYARIARTRRHYYAQPGRARRLARPVVSVGNVASGGRGKTPIVARVASLLLAAGERPAILSRGYARRDAAEGVTVVSDGTRLLADLGRAGDEPLMLARAVPGAGVFVCADRYWAGTLAERRFGASVHVLDDGFQHVQVRRDVDLVVVAPEDERASPLPSGRLRESFETVRMADALLVSQASPAEAAALAARWGVPHAFSVTRTRSVPRLVEPWGPPLRISRDIPIVALAGIAQPEAFFAELEADGWTIAARLPLRDHQGFTARTLTRLAGTVRDSGAGAVLTTEKDAVRLLPWRPLPVPVAFVPLVAAIEPTDVFQTWLLATLERARGDVGAGR